jgi:hypothetical protein
MLSQSKRAKMLDALKAYKKKFLDKNISDLDESGTRILINHFLSEVLGYSTIEEIKTEFMIRGTYADYMIQIGGERHFLVEVKALALQLSEKHLRQTVNYGANEGIEWALLTNGRSFEFYKIIFSQPIESCKLFTVELTDVPSLRAAIDHLQYLHKDSVIKKGLKMLWNKCEATNVLTIAGILCSKEVVGLVRKLVKNKYQEKCEETNILKVIQQVLIDAIDPAVIKPFRSHKSEGRTKIISKKEAVELVKANVVQLVQNVPPISEN